MNYIAPYRKALVPVIVAVALGVLAKTGVTGDMSVTDAVTYLVTAGLVYAIPNSKA